MGHERVGALPRTKRWQDVVGGISDAASVDGDVREPRITRPQVYRVVREMLPRERFGPEELLRWLEDTQDSNERARRSHAKRRAAMRASPHILP